MSFGAAVGLQGRLETIKEPDEMTAHRVGTREEWLAARVELLADEKELTRRSDAIARRRQELPWVPVEREYTFATVDGMRTLPDLFAGRSQLLVYHFMFGPADVAGCPGCSFTVDSLDGDVVHLNHHDVAFVAVSRAPLERLHAYRRRMGWSFPWVSSVDDFNVDFAVFTDEERHSGSGFNFGTGRHADMNVRTTELHGLSAFVLSDGVVHHTYSCYDRGTDVLSGTWQLLDRTPKGRGESPEGWPHRHDEYATALTGASA
jgi:predicted dithiol-disulfide oxidoreductase (DUF899 family)